MSVTRFGRTKRAWPMMLIYDLTAKLTAKTVDVCGQWWTFEL